MENVDFDQVNRIALANIESLLSEWLPGGKRVGHEYQGGSWAGGKGKSLLINLRTGKGGDFAGTSDDQVGDMVGVCGKIFGLDRVAAARKIAGIFGLPGGDNQTTELRPYRPAKTKEQIKAEDATDEAEKQRKVDEITAECVDLRGTPAQAYLKKRGITGCPPHQFMFRPNKKGNGGSLVCIARNAAGEVKAVQSIYINENGEKANFSVKKRTNGFPGGNPLIIKARTDGGPRLITEGPEDGLTLAQCTKYEVWIGFGLNFFEKMRLPDDGKDNIIVRDNDAPDSKPDQSMAKILAHFIDAGVKRLKCARPPLDIKDSNDLLRAKGPEAVAEMVRNAQPVEDARNVEETEDAPPPPEYFEPADYSEYEDNPAITEEDRLFEELAYLPRTDVGNAKRIVKRWGRIVKFAPGIGWLIYNKGTWEKKHADLRVINMAKATAVDIAKEQQYVEEHQKNGIRAWAKKSQEGGRISYMIKLAQPDLVISAEKLDKDKQLFNCANGVVNLRTGLLLPHSTEYYCTNHSDVEFDLNAGCPLWTKFLNSIFEGNSELISFVQRSVGYSLTGETKEQCIFVLYGNGSNGKSTFLDVIQSVLNTYHTKTRAEAFMNTGKTSDANPFLAMLRSSRMATASETDENKPLDESTIKEVTGERTITVRSLHKDPFQFRPQFKLWLATNHKPEIRGTDEGIWRRIMLIPFNAKFYNAEDPNAPIEGPFKDKDMLEKLEAEAKGILAWAVRGAVAWNKNGLQVPDEVREATEDYRTEMDVIGAFLEENTERGDRKKVACSILYENYKHWCTDAGCCAFSKSKFGRRLYERGIQKGTMPNGSKAYVWITLKQSAFG